MFYDRFIHFCKENNIPPSRAAIEAGLSKSTVSKWKSDPEAEPSGAALKKIADYFQITIAELLGDDAANEKAPTLTKKDERDIARDLDRVMNDLEGSGDLMFDGAPMSPEAMESLRAAIKVGLEIAKVKNKETYTPKKYKKPKQEE